MSHLLTMALMREFPGVELNRLLIDHPEATVVGVKGAKFVVVPLPSGQTAYYAYRQGSLHRLNSAPLALRKLKGSARNAAGVSTAGGDGGKTQHPDPKLANAFSQRFRRLFAGWSGQGCFFEDDCAEPGDAPRPHLSAGPVEEALVFRANFARQMLLDIHP